MNREVLKLRQNAKNVTIDCYGYGKPRPSVTWRKGVAIIPLVPVVTANNSDVVFQRVVNMSGYPWNVTSRLYVRLDGMTYQEAGNYACEVSNGVGNQGTVNATSEILCKYFSFDMLGGGGVLWDFRSEGRCFEAWVLRALFCFRRQETLL